MDKFILKNIDFSKCATYLLLSGILWFTSMVIAASKVIPQQPLQTALHLIELVLTTYIYLGFVKFSILNSKYAFRKLIIIAMVLSIIQMLIAIAATLIGINDLYSYIGVAVTIELALLFFAFKTVQNESKIDFRKLSRLYLYLLFFHIPTSVAFLLLQDKLKTTIPQVLILPVAILFLLWAALSIYTWYSKIKVFKQISLQIQ